MGNNFIRLDESISSINGDKSRLEEENTNLRKIISNLEGGYTKSYLYENLKSYFDVVTEEELTGDDNCLENVLNLEGFYQSLNFLKIILVLMGYIDFVKIVIEKK